MIRFDSCSWESVRLWLRVRLAWMRTVDARYWLFARNLVSAGGP